MSRIARRPLLGGLAALVAPAPPLRAQGGGAGAGGGSAAAPGAAPAPAAGSELRLGALFPFSGSLALLGDESFRGLELAVEERNAAGGLLGRAIRLAKGDAAGPEQAMAELRRLQSAERVAAGFGTFASALPPSAG